jgi:NAD(P)-dependent dehydrogenase (short-subunit alcohol dehydrogenase family)
MSQQPSHPFDLRDKVALVTGGASGIGAGVAATLAAAGAFVVIADIHRENAEREVGKLLAAGHRAASVIINLAEEDSIVSGCADVVSRHGTPWVLVNNAGLQDRQTFLESTAEEWDRMNRVNGRGPFLMSREIVRAMIAAGQGGRIINIGSAALQGSIVKGLVSYAGSKGALVGMSGATAFELAEHAITVNVVLPGATITPGAMQANGPAPVGPASSRAPALGYCEAEDIAAAVLYFASPAARRVTNQVLAVDGGFSVT